MSLHLSRPPVAPVVVVALFACSLGCLFGCSDSSAVPKTKAAASQPAPQATFDVTKVKLSRTDLVAPARVKAEPSFTTALEAMFSAYLRLKDAGVKSDAAAMKAGFIAWQSKFEAVKAIAPPAAAKALFTKQLAAADEGIAWVKEHGQNLKSLRRAFSPISEAMVAMAASFEHSMPLFVQFCPMALDKGAHWLSKEKPIRNPYYGDMMLECGEVQGTIVPKS